MKMKIVFHASIKFRVKENHPDLKYIPENERSRVFEYDDTYTIDPDYFYGMDDIRNYIERDLKLIASGGYRIDTILVEDIQIKAAG